METTAAIKPGVETHSPVYYGIRLAAIFSAIFLISKLFGLEQVVWLRYLNYAIFFPVAYFALRNAYRSTNKLNYFYGLKIGFLTCLFGQLFYAVLFFIYLHIDKPLVNYIQSQMPTQLLSPEMSISFLLFSEGLAWSAITAFSMMQIFKWKRGNWAVHS